jgi:hypothetical protein
MFLSLEYCLYYLRQICLKILNKNTYCEFFILFLSLNAKQISFLSLNAKQISFLSLNAKQISLDFDDIINPPNSVHNEWYM